MADVNPRRISRRSLLVAASAGAGLVAAGTPASAAEETDYARPWPSLAGTEWILRRRGQRASIVELGGGLREYTVDGVPFVDPYPLDSPVKSAGRVLAPWPNRLRDGLYTFGAVTQQLAITDVPRRSAIHGFSRFVLWRPIRRSRDSITLACVIAPQPGYPHPLRLTTRWSLTDDGLRADHVAVNLGATPAPFGLGTHPGLRVGDALIDGLDLHLPAVERITVDDRLLPTGKVPVAGTPYDFTTPRPMGDLQLDTGFTGLVRGADGRTTTRLSAPNGPWVELWQDATFGWLQLFNGLGPSGRPRGTLAVEPMTCPADAFNSGEGLIVLQPGARWAGSWGIRASTG